MIDSAVILAIGQPTHQTTLTQQRPRAMLPALGKPMVVRVMDRLYQAGIRDYIVLLGMDEGPVAAYLNRQWMPDANVTFEINTEGASLASLLAKVARQLDNPFMIAAYNSFMYERFVQSLVLMHDDHPEDLIVTGAHLSLSPDAKNYYAVADDLLIQSVTTEKPGEKHFVLGNHVIVGKHMVAQLAQASDAALRDYGSNLGQLVTHYLTQPDAKARIGETSWLLRIESDAHLLTLNKRLLEDSNDAHILSELPYTVKLIPPVRIDPQVSVGQGVILGPHVYVERNASIGYGAKLSNTIVLEGSSIRSDSEVSDSIVAGSRTIKI